MTIRHIALKQSGRNALLKKIDIFTYQIHNQSVSTEKIHTQLLRNRPFNLLGGGGVMVFVSFRIFFSNYTRVRILFFLSRKARIVFFPEYNITLFDKNSKSDFLSSNKIRIFFSATLGIRIFKKKNPYLPPPLQVKWSFPYEIRLICIEKVEKS
jgi:hypothetical protein